MNRRDLIFGDLSAEDFALVSLNCRKDAVRDINPIKTLLQVIDSDFEFGRNFFPALFDRPSFVGRLTASLLGRP